MLRESRRYQSVAEWLARSDTRAYTHAALLLGLSLAVLGSEFTFGFADSADPFMPHDKRLHYDAGRMIAAGVFYIAYACIIIRVLLAAKRSVTRALLWLPTLLGLGLLAATAAAAVLGVGKEALDAQGMGAVEWLDFETTLQGAATIAPSVALIMALTPFFLPLDVLMQLPKLMLSDARVGIGALDDYVKARRAHKGSERGATVLLVEDDIVCATTALEFCRLAGLTCHHVCSISEAEQYLRTRGARVRLVLLDNFVRVDPRGGNRTGSDWLAEIDTTFPPERRMFWIVMISGHVNQLGPAAAKADLVLQKPWEPSRLAEFLREKRLLQNQELCHGR